MRGPHPAVSAVLHEPLDLPFSDRDRSSIGLEQTTSPSLARALAIGCLSGLNPEVTHVNVWDPAAGSGYAGEMLVSALESTGIHVLYRGQDIDGGAVAASR